LAAVVVAVAAASFLAGTVARAQDTGGVVVNQVPLGDDAVRALEAVYATPIQGGAYWYDPVSGLWGPQGGPPAGQLHPGLALGGPLRADASNGDTGVFINGREIHVLELRTLQRLFGDVPRGRYWLNAQGIGGSEGGPPAFDLTAAARPAAGPAGTGNTSGAVDRGPFGSWGSDGTCWYVAVPDGSSYMPPGC
jgi:hypothetical protein